MTTPRGGRRDERLPGGATLDRMRVLNPWCDDSHRRSDIHTESAKSASGVGEETGDGLGKEHDDVDQQHRQRSMRRRAIEPHGLQRSTRPSSAILGLGEPRRLLDSELPSPSSGRRHSAPRGRRSHASDDPGRPLVLKPRQTRIQAHLN